MKKTIYLHIGTHKTGTTTIQEFLFINRKLLKVNNYDYLEGNCFWNAHHPLGWSFQGANKAIEYYCSWSRDGIINHLEYEINNSTCDNFIISSENLFHLKNIAFIKSFFSRFCEFNIKVVVYLRNQVSFLESWYAELIRADYCKLNEDFEDFVKEPRYNLNYYSELKKWEEYVKMENIIVLNFLNEAKNGNLIDNFCKTIQLNCNKEFIRPPSTNEKINDKQLQLLRELNNQTISHENWLKERENILNNFKIDTENKVPLMNEVLKNKIIEEYKESNTLLNTYYHIKL